MVSGGGFQFVHYTKSQGVNRFSHDACKLKPLASSYFLLKIFSVCIFKLQFCFSSTMSFQYCGAQWHQIAVEFHCCVRFLADFIFTLGNLESVEINNEKFGKVYEDCSRHLQQSTEVLRSLKLEDTENNVLWFLITRSSFCRCFTEHLQNWLALNLS